MHVHLAMAGREALPLLLAAGVTGVRDMGGDPVVLRWRDSITSGALLGPRIKAAGIIVESARWLQMVKDLTMPLGRPQLMQDLERRFAVATPEDAERAVDSLFKLGADFVKIRNYPSAAAYFALVRAAKRHGMAIAGHAPPMAFVAIVSDSGFASLEHALLDNRDGGLVEAFGSLALDARRDLFGRLARNGTAWDPTFVSGASRQVPDSALARMIADSTGKTDSTLRFVPPALREEWRSALAMRSVDPDTTTDWAAIHHSSLGVVRELTDAGVSILAGTDLGVPSLVPGFSLLRELEVLVSEARLSPREALAAATINASTTLGLQTRSGRVAPGYYADMVLLDHDPLVNIAAVRAIRAVIARGRVFDRGALDRLRASAGR
jgi:imidazolonepropionase-like amidohydrolase